MLEIFTANVWAHLTFFRRNRLVLAASIIMLFVMGLSTLPSLFFTSSNKQFEIITIIFSRLNLFTFLLTGGLGLFLVAAHLRARNIKMVVTKPCPPEVWLLTGFVAAALVSLFLHAGVLGVSLLLSVIWNVPVQSGFLFLAIDSFSTSLILLSYLMFLSMVMHPVLAIIVSLLFNEGAFYGLMTIFGVARNVNDGGFWSSLGYHTAKTVYFMTPMTDPLAGKGIGVYYSYKTELADWSYLGESFVYMIAICGMFYFLSCLFLRRKTLI